MVVVEGFLIVLEAVPLGSRGGSADLASMAFRECFVFAAMGGVRAVYKKLLSTQKHSPLRVQHNSCNNCSHLQEHLQNNN